jgi:RHS repeat-associated protein
MAVNNTSEQIHFPAYDGNGNLMVLVRAETGTNATVDAAYEYDPFGRTVRATGPAAQGNPFRFSTKFTDDETGLVYYGYRYYDAMLGRWLSRDPIAEAGGKNLFAMVENSVTGRWDLLGLQACGSLEFFNPNYNKDADVETGFSIIVRKSPANRIVVGIHGTYKSVWDSNTRIFHNAKWLSKHIKSLPNFDKSTEILLLACNTGNTSLSRNPFAQKLANLLCRTVIAPARFGWISTDGRYGSVPPMPGAIESSLGVVALDWSQVSPFVYFEPKPMGFFEGLFN